MFFITINYVFYCDKIMLCCKDGEAFVGYLII